MPSRRDRIDTLLTRLVTQLEKAADRPEGLTAAEAGVLITLHTKAVGTEDPSDRAAGDWTDEEKRLIHELARGVDDPGGGDPT